MPDNKNSMQNFLQQLINQPTTPYKLSLNAINYQNQEFTITSEDGTSYRFTPLMVFAYTNNIPLAKAFLQQSSNPKNTVAYGNNEAVTPLMIAAYKGHKKFVKLLLKNGANPNTLNLQGNSALHYAAQANRKKTVDLLLNYGADPVLKNKNGETPADLTQDQNIKNALIVWHTFQSSRTFIKDISQDKATEVPQELSATLLNLPIPFTLTINNKQFDVQFTPLMVAAYKGDYEIAQKILQKGANPDSTNNEGTTALTVACNFGDIKFASLLLQHGADINKQDNEGMSCLMYATLRNHEDFVTMLLQAGANPELVNDEGFTAQQLAAGKKEPQTSPTIQIKQKLEQLFQKPQQYPQTPAKKIPEAQKNLLDLLEKLKNNLKKVQAQFVQTVAG
jgi:ankyrin repeat protein